MNLVAPGNLCPQKIMEASTHIWTKQLFGDMVAADKTVNSVIEWWWTAPPPYRHRFLSQAELTPLTKTKAEHEDEIIPTMRWKCNCDWEWELCHHYKKWRRKWVKVILDGVWVQGHLWYQPVGFPVIKKMSCDQTYIMSPAAFPKTSRTILLTMSQCLNTLLGKITPFL